MADVKTMIKQMKDAGMVEAEILANLNELGIENAEDQMAQALKDAQPRKQQQQSQTEQEQGLRITRIDGEKEQTVDIGRVIETGESNGELMKKVASSDFANTDEMEDKLDQIIGLLKALQEINKQILETNRDLLVKMNKKAQESEKPTLGKIF